LENESGSIEEITSTYVVVRLPDLRRLIVPLSFFIEKPFYNWTRKSTATIGVVTLYVDYTAPVEKLRKKLTEIGKQSKVWDEKIAELQVTDAKENTVELSIKVGAPNPSAAFDLRCEVREKMIAYMQNELPGAMPRSRQEVVPSPREETDEEIMPV